MPKISVLMPVYNTKEEYLREAIESILNQTYTDFEFIIINDGSTNNAEEVTLSYKDARIKYYKNNKNKGLIFTLNYGFTLTNGEYIARMDADDVSTSERFEKQIEFMEENPDIDILGAWMEDIPSTYVTEYPLDNEKIVKYLLFIYCAISHPTVFMKSELIDKFDITYKEADAHAEDYGLWLSLINKVKFANLSDILLKRRIHDEQVSHVYTDIQTQNAHRLRLKAQKQILGIDTDRELKIIEKILQRQKITIDEMQILTKHLAFELDHVIEYEDCRKYFKLMYKRIIKYSLKTPRLILAFWTHPINKKLKVKCVFKFKTLIGK